MSDELNDFTTYSKSISLIDVAYTMRDFQIDILKKNNPSEEFLLGFHIRHFLDSNAPTYVASHSNKTLNEKIESTIEANKKYGLHTFNHLIDSLYKQDKNKTDSENDTFIHTKIFFDNSLEKRVNNQNFNDCVGFNLKKGVISLKTSQLSIEDDLDIPYDALSVIDSFCESVKIDRNLINLRAIFYSMQQLNTFSFAGKNVDVIVLRPKSEIGYVLGFTLIRKEEVINITPALNMLSNWFRYLNDGVNFANNILEKETEHGYQPFFKIKNFQGLKMENSLDIPQHLTDEICKDITQNTDKKSEKLLSGLKNTIKSFLNIIQEFSEEQVEGKKITYGFVLGNPGLVDFLIGKKVLPATDNNKKQSFLTLEEYRNNYYLFSNHLKTALILPYINTNLNDDSFYPFFFIDIENFEEDIFNWKDGSIIPNQYKAYAYLSYRFPWAVSAVVGPGSQIRVFSNGKILAYKDGKGWKTYGRHMEYIQDAYDDLNYVNNKLEKFFETACMLSPIYNKDSMGGFIIYCKSFNNNPDVLEDFEKRLEPMSKLEPFDSFGKPWLRGKNLFNEKGDIDYKVANRLMQISILDGAIVMTGDNFTIKDFGVRLNFNTNETKNAYGGTKTNTACDFVYWCHQYNIYDAFAVAISSDGPLKIFHPKLKDLSKPLVIYERFKTKKYTNENRS